MAEAESTLVMPLLVFSSELPALVCQSCFQPWKLALPRWVWTLEWVCRVEMDGCSQALLLKKPKRYLSSRALRGPDSTVLGANSCFLADCLQIAFTLLCFLPMKARFSPCVLKGNGSYLVIHKNHLKGLLKRQISDNLGNWTLIGYLILRNYYWILACDHCIVCVCITYTEKNPYLLYLLNILVFTYFERKIWCIRLASK